MELSKEDLEKIIKGVAEVIGVKRESAEVEEDEKISEIEKFSYYIEAIKLKDNTINLLNTKKETLFDEMKKELDDKNIQQLLGVISYIPTDNGFSIKINGATKIFELKTNEEKILIDSKTFLCSFVNKNIEDFVEISKNIKSKLSDIYVYFDFNNKQYSDILVLINDYIKNTYKEVIPKPNLNKYNPTN